MNNKQNYTLFPILLILLSIGILSRFIPHYPNFTAIPAVGIFSGMLLGKRFMTYLIPIFAMFIMDSLLFGLTSHVYTVYPCILFSVYLGGKFTAAFNSSFHKSNFIVSFQAALLFYLVTNFQSWYIGYPHTIEGFFTCYYLALPFFISYYLGSIFYMYVLQKSYQLLAVPRLEVLNIKK